MVYGDFDATFADVMAGCSGLLEKDPQRGKYLNGKTNCSFNDLPGYGKVALAAMVPLFSRMGHFPYQVPTAVVSNTLDFGKFRIQDMTDYMRDTIKVWDELWL